MPRKRAKLLHLVTSTQKRGAEIRASELAAALAAGGWPYRLAALVAAEGPTIEAEVLGRRRLGLPTMVSLRRRMAEAGIIIANGSTSLPAASVAGVGMARPVVYRSIGDPRHWAPTLTKRLRTAALLRRVDRVVALSDGAAAALHEWYRVPIERLTVIPNGIAMERLPSPSVEDQGIARRRLGIRDDAPIVLCLGSLTPEKNLGLAIDAIGRLKDSRLLVVGEGPERAALEHHAKRTLGARATFLGAVPNPIEVLIASDLLLMSSTSEGMPGVAIEASAMGRPVVSTDVGWVREIVVDGVSGLVVRPGDVEALADAVSRALGELTTMGAAGSRYCRSRFDLGVLSGRWSAMLEQLL